jgi:hypothetical protein
MVLGIIKGSIIFYLGLFRTCYLEAISLGEKMGEDEFEGEILNSDGREFEEIQEASGMVEAINIAQSFVAENNLFVDDNTIAAVVYKIRTFE